MQAFTANTPVWIETAPNTYTQVTVSTGWTSWTNYTPTGNSLKVHGELRYFDCSGTGTSTTSRSPVTAINASGNTALQQLYCNYTNLTSLTLTGLTNLNYLSCYYGQFTSLNLTGLSNLQTLYCYNNQLTSLTLTGLTNLRTLHCGSNPLGSLNLTGLTKLTSLTCSSNQLTSLDLTDLTNLTSLNYGSNRIPNLDLSGLTNLQTLQCYNNYLTSLNLDSLKNLRHLYCYNNSLTSLNLDNLKNLRTLYCASNPLGSLNLDSLKNLTSLYCQSNQLTSLNLDSLKNLSTLYCGSNPLGSLNLDSLKNLTSLYCYSNQLTSLDLTGLTKLQYLSCYSNQLTSLDLTGLTKLYNLSCYSNQISSLTLTGLTELQYLYCYSNRLTSLNLTGLTKLRTLRCYNNQISSLTLTGLTALQELNCGNNQLTGFDLTGLSALKTLECYGNPCTRTTYGLDTTYCNLPQRSTSDNAIIYVTTLSSAEPFVLATNRANANNSNWKVYGRRGSATASTYEITNTTGSYVCGTILVTDVTLSPTSLDLVIGESDSVFATVIPANADNKAVTWSSSDTSVATVAAGTTAGTAVVTAGTVAGTATITVTTVDGRFTAECLVTVTIPVTGVTLSPKTLNLVLRETSNIMATVLPANASNKAVTWSSSDPSVATVAAGATAGSAIVTAGTTVGTTTITVTTVDGGKTDSCLVNVRIPVTGVTLSPSTLDLLSGETGSIMATVLPADATNKSLTWSSDNPNIATVAAGATAGSAIVTAGRVDGTATITVTTVDGSFTAECLVTVTIPVTGVTLSPTTLDLLSGESGNIMATVLPADATNKAITWSTDNPDIATVTAGATAGSAIVTAGRVDGTATITVTTEDGSFTAECLVTVTIPVAGVMLLPPTLDLVLGETSNIMATVLPFDATNKAVTWSTDNPDIATVAAGATAGSAVVTAGTTVGTATITVTTVDGSFTDSCLVSVRIPVAGVTLSPPTLKLVSGRTGSIIATVLPADATNKAVTWSSDNPDIATVAEGATAGSAVVTAGTMGGTVNITATTEDGSFTASCLVTVTIPVTGVTLSPTSLNLVLGETGNISAAVLPVDATNKAVTWSSDDPAVASITVAHVSDVCIVKGISVGSTTITARSKDGKKTATCLVTVTPKITPVFSISVSPSSLDLKVGESKNVTATILPADATNKAVTWSSDNPDVATVSKTGKVTGLAVGTATITVTTEDGAKTATCVVTVYDTMIPVTGVTLDKETLTINKGESASLTATILPADATKKAVVWSSDSPDIATVDNVGKVTALSAGTATITVTTVDGGFTATCLVTVRIPVTGITLDKETLTIKKGESATLIATVLPADATNKSVTWSSDKPKIAKVDNTGKIAALSVGTATITVTTKEGNFTATCAVTVEEEGSVEELIASGVNVWTFNGVLHIDFKESVLSDRVVSIFDMSGKLVYSNSTPSDELQIHLPSGVYIVKVGDIAFKVLITQ